MKISLRIILSTCLLLVTAESIAQKKIKYEQVFYKIDSLALEQKAIEALGLIQTLNDEARREGNTMMLLKSVMYRMLFQNYLRSSTQASLIETLKRDVALARQPEKSILQSLLAESYWHYLQQNRYRISQRTFVSSDIGDDVQTWSLRKLTDQIIQSYISSLNEKEILQSTNIGLIKEVLVGDTATRHLRPTVYDLLTHRALSVFMNTQINITRPGLDEVSFNKGILSDAKSFMELTLPPSDSNSFSLQGLKIFQELLKLHKRSTNRAAFADANFKRLKFSYQLSNDDDKSQYFFEALQQMLPEAEDTDIYADVLYEQAVLYKNNQLKSSKEYHLVKALALADEAIMARPNSPGAQNASQLAKTIRTTSLSVYLKNQVASNKPIQLNLSYTNIQAAFLRLYKIPAEILYFNEIAGNKPTYFKFLKNAKPIREWKIDLPAYSDYQNHSYGDYFEGLPLGHYVLIAQDRDILDTLGTDITSSYANFRVTDLGITFRTIESNHHQYLVRNSSNGKPLKGVLIKEFTERSYQKTLEPRAVMKTDGKGYAASDTFQYIGSALITLGMDTVKLGIQNNSRNYKPVKSVMLFTDRPIYRPGQTVFYKGLHMESLDSKNEIITNEEIVVNFTDPNGQQIRQDTTITNEFGTFKGSFELPTGKLNGVFRISTKFGSIQVQVEEYKRPTFEVQFDELQERYKLGDSILVKGKATAYSGYQIGRAAVKYMIYRTQETYSRNLASNETKPIATGNTVTNNDGSFSLKFFAAKSKENEEYGYTFLVKAEITEPGGETRSAEKSLTAGEKDLRLISNIPDFIYLGNKPDTIPVRVQNLNGQPTKAKLTVEWYPLQAPTRLTHRSWSGPAPEKHSLTRDAFITTFPYEDLGDENFPSNWPESKSAILKQSVIAETGDAPVLVRSDELKPGYYKIRMSAVNTENDTIRQEGIIRLHSDQPEEILTMQEWLRAEKLEITPKEEAVFRIASAASGAMAYYEVYYKNEVTERVWLALSSKQTVVKISPKLHYENAFAVQFSMIQHGAVYNSLHTVNILDPTKELDIKFLTFRDKLQPGELEKWKLKITNKAGEKQMAEMVATLYDASLDVLKTMNWQEIRTGYDYGGYSWASNLGHTSNGTALWFLKPYYDYYRTFVREYESLSSYLTPYATNGQGQYNMYLKTADKNLLKRDSIETALKLSRLAKGTKVFGIVKDDFGFVVPDASVVVNNKTQTKTDRYGIYEIAARGGDIVHVKVPGYQPYLVKVKQGQKRLNIILKNDYNRLAEVVIRGYQKRSREQTTGSSYIVSGKEVNDGAPGMRSSTSIRGLSTSTSNDNTVLLQGRVAGLNIQEDTKVYDFVTLDSYDPKTGNYIINGKLVKSLSKVVTRTNFNETAFFHPQLRTNAAGEIVIEFTIPQSLTRFKMLGFAHTKDLKNTVVSRELITQKQFSISASAPRFFREGDTILFTAKLFNLSGKSLKGNAALELTDALTGKPLRLMLPGSGISEGQRFQAADKGSELLKWPLVIPSGISAISYKVVAESGKYSDGEEMTIPVLPNAMLVTETLALNIRGNSSKTFTMDKLLQSARSTTLRNQSYTLEFTANPVWYAIQSLPYLMEYPYECAEQTFSRFYANSFATAIVNSSPKISEVFKQWQEDNGGEALLSNLEKNQQLKSILLEETPWVRNSANETERKKRVGVLFELNRMSRELKSNFDKLEQMQFPNGSFPWFNGMEENRYITQHIVLGMAQLKHLKVVDEEAYPNFSVMLNRALIYLDNKLTNDYALSQKDFRFDYLPLHYLYARSYSKQINTSKAFTTAFNYYLEKLAVHWGSLTLYQQGMAALVFHRNGDQKLAMKIVNALKERSQISDEMGMFWPENTDGWWWYQRSIETQALMVEVFDEVASDTNSVEELKIWLLKNKQTTDWKTTKATTAACYALLMRGYNLLDESAEPEILLGDKTFAQLGIAEPKKEAGTGYRKVSLVGAQVIPELGKVTIKNNNKGIAWGGLYWQYFEQLDKITPAETGIKIKKQLFVQEQTTSGTVLHPLTTSRTLKTGDLLKVRIEIYSDRDMEYLHLKDMRSSGFEPVNVISTYKYQDGLGYYESTKDASTNFFIGYMRKGTYVFEYPLRVSHAGNFSNGITTLQSMYAPEFSTHSEGIRTMVKP